MLARLLQRDHHTADDDPLFPGDAGWLDASALRRRYLAARTRAGLRPLKLHDLRHTFGSLAARTASLRDLQEWLGHADAKTTARYMHYRSRGDEAARLAPAFATASPASGVQTNGRQEAAAAFHPAAAAEAETVEAPALARHEVEPAGRLSGFPS